MEWGCLRGQVILLSLRRDLRGILRNWDLAAVSPRTWPPPLWDSVEDTSIVGSRSMDTFVAWFDLTSTKLMGEKKSP